MSDETQEMLHMQKSSSTIVIASFREATLMIAISDSTMFP